jgi:hypothetical protein
LVANIATAGVEPFKRKNQFIVSAFQRANKEQTVCFLQKVRNKIRLMSVMKCSDREFELVGKLQSKGKKYELRLGSTLVNNVP